MEDEGGFLKTAQCAVLPPEMSLRKVKGANGARASVATLCAPY